MRYLALTKLEREQMMNDIGISHIDELYAAAPKEFILKEKISALPDHKGEIEVDSYLKKLSEKNKSASSMPFFLGAGCYQHHVPAAVDHLIQRSEFLTAYTPYQPEISQGTLKTIFQFQTIITRLTGMDVANASLYDGATGVAEAALMAVRVKRNKRKIAILGDLNPDYLEVLKTYTDLAEIELISEDQIDENTAAIITAYPDFYGNITDLNAVRAKADEVGALMIVVVTEILSLGLLEAPKMADIVTGEASSIGVGLNFGGPHLGFFACREKYVRQVPGRICGATTDEDDLESFVLTLNAREQHIRRDKATSNICSNQGLCAVAFTIHSFLLGEIGFKNLALLNHNKACKLADLLSEIDGVTIINDSFFNEFTIKLAKNAKEVNQKLLEQDIIGGLALDNNLMVIAVTELTSDEDMAILAKNLKEIL
ncbi:aminomethyl-transferring glycine dehydrogenase subunit GcvPA [Rickettsiales bacterium]|nr:aminomethyl-transferring glycine dehydrogenase subunit GcvPA [Rickettsiales bacterium]